MRQPFLELLRASLKVILRDRCSIPRHCTANSYRREGHCAMFPPSFQRRVREEKARLASLAAMYPFPLDGCRHYPSEAGFAQPSGCARLYSFQLHKEEQHRRDFFHRSEAAMQETSMVGGRRKLFSLEQYFRQISVPKTDYGSRPAAQRHPRRSNSATPGISIAQVSCPSGVWNTRPLLYSKTNAIG